MIAVIFEVVPDPAHRDRYLEIAASIRTEVEKVDGFISIERFQSLTDANKMLSLSYFRDEEAVIAWRNLEAHRRAQAQGRAGIFKDYRLRIAHIIRDYGMYDREQAPADSRTVHD